MQGLRQFGLAILTSLISIGLVIGGLSLALSENEASQPASTDSLPQGAGTPAALLTGTPSALVLATSTDVAGALLPSATPRVPGSATLAPSTPTNASTTCGPPFGWARTYVVQPGDTLFHIAQSYSTTTAALQQANCKGSSTNINSGERLWVPGVATRTPGVTVIPDFPTSTPVPTDPLTETPLPYTASPVPTHTTVPATQTPLPTVTPTP